MGNKILITGGTGLIGSRLKDMLIEEGFEVAFLSRSKTQIPNVSVFQWNIETGLIDPKAFENVSTIVHLAGAGIADARWTDARKAELIETRIKPIKMLEEAILTHQYPIKSLISASAIGFYGGETAERQMDENSPVGNDFLAECTQKWEAAADDFQKNTGIKTAKIRVGVVLSKNGGALEKMIIPIKMMIGSPLGSGKQWISWIHIDDICRIFIDAIEHKIEGTINAVSPNPVRNETLTATIAKVLNKPLFAPKVPEFILKTLMGEMAVVALGSCFVKNSKLQNESDFVYQFPTIESALKDLLND
jgi:uncharacterized protein